jgi:hypothetical protein
MLFCGTQKEGKGTRQLEETEAESENKTSVVT